jgi:hypothetical protein
MRQYRVQYNLVAVNTAKMYKLNFMYMNISFRIRVRIFVKKIIHLNFISKFLGRIFFQSLVKTFRLFSNFTRLKGSIWVDLNKDLFDTWAIKKDKGALYSSN